MSLPMGGVKNSIENSKSGRNPEPKASDVGCGLQKIHRKTFERCGFQYLGTQINGSRPIITLDCSEFSLEGVSTDYLLIS